MAILSDQEKGNETGEISCRVFAGRGRGRTFDRKEIWDVKS